MPAMHKQPTSRFDDQVRRDRYTALAVAAIVMTLIGLVLWLQSITGQSYPADQFWPLIP